jgi:sugar lactone lactonase YvrE
VPAARGDFLVGTENGIERFDPASGALTPFVHPEREVAGNRFNDAKCDPAGRLWAGTMAISEAPHRGSLYRVEAGGRCTRTVERISISNGLAWSRDGRTMYYIDSPTRRVDAFDFDAETGAIANRRQVVELTDGFPDGMCIDAEDRLWIAVWGGWAVACHDPRTGQRVDRIEVPAEAVTSCCFGDGGDLYITTASRDVTDATRKSQPEAGGLFRVRLPVGGPPPPAFRG